MSSRKRVVCRVLLGLLATVALTAVGASSASAASARWELSVVPHPTNFVPNDSSGDNLYFIVATNVGNASTDGTKATFTDHLPPGLTATKIEFYPFNLGWKGYQPTSPFGGDKGAALCSVATVKCVYPGSSGLPPLAPGEELLMTVHVATHPEAAETLVNTVTATGGGAPEATLTTTSTLSSAKAPFGEAFSISSLSADGTPSTQAGAHPYALTTSFDYATTHPSQGSFFLLPSEDAKSSIVDLPPGFIGNPQAVPQCKLFELASEACPPDSQVGTAVVEIENLGRWTYRVYNLEPQPGYAAELVLNNPHGFGSSPVLIAGVRTGTDYGVEIRLAGGIPALGVLHVSVTVWGSPSDPSHDLWRERICGNIGCFGGGVPSGVAEPRPYLTNPTSCAGSPLPVSSTFDSWEHAETFGQVAKTIPAMTACNQVPFEPTIQARPTTNLADSASGLDVDLHLPLKGFEEPEAISESNLRDTTVTLPPGLLVNPASANGLQGCSEAQIGYKPGTSAPFEFSEGPAACPDASKLGTVEVDTPLLDHPLPGAVYLARQGENPFNSLLALYIAIDDPETGVVVKLAGKVTPDEHTGQLAATFEESPQLPFEDFKLHFFGGAQGALRTPPTCGSFTTTSVLTPWSAPESGPPATPHDEFTIASPPSGSGACPTSAGAEPNAPLFRAGTESPQAGIYSPFALKLVREDGSQEIKGIDTTLPPGLTGKLAGVGECSDAALATAAAKTGVAEQASPSCPPITEVGTVDVASGAGPTPLNVSGKAYLSGPYKSAPLSLAIVTPAVAGPFDLGTVVVRTALYVNPETAQIHAVSDEIPHILQGIPLDVRSIALKMNRPNFTLNPTSCSELAFTGSALSVFGQSAPLTQRFQVGGCSALAFKPKLKLSLKGDTNRTGHPALKAVLTAKPGEANIHAAQVTLPHSAFLEQGHIRTICTNVQFNANACPAGAIYGKATAVTPLLDKPLSGPVYLRSSSHQLPDLVANLDGQIHVVLDGKVDSINARLRNTFEAVPDAPVSKFILEMQGGKKGLIVNSENLCSPQAKTHAIVAFTGQNGKTYNTEPTVANSCKKKGKRHGHGKGKHPSHRVGTSHR